jgi:hypothetical protein
MEPTDGYHWFRHDEGTTFIAWREEGFWYVPGDDRPIATMMNATYIRPVEPPPCN